MTRGRPLRFLGGVVAGWTALRVVMLWPAGLAPPPLVAAPAMAALERPRPKSLSLIKTTQPPARLAAPAAPRVDAATIASAPASPARPPEPAVPAFAVGETSALTERSRDDALASAPATQHPAIIEQLATRRRFAADTWLVLRPGGGDSLPFGQLGASQGGARLTYAVDDERRIALSARLSAPVRGVGREAGLGLDVRPTRLPVHLLVEERIGLDRGGARPAAEIITGGSVALPTRTRLDAYAQGGAVWRRGGFVDAAALAARPVLEHGAARVEVGAGAWGAAQRRVARLDLGPAVALVAPLGGHAVRLQLDYRLRVAGRARPGSGPALTLGGSF